MARTPKLKVYRTPIGFHDAYVAAPSQKAAAEAWGTDAGIFARGEAELVTDPALAAGPLASPGVVIKRLRGTAAEQIAALGPEQAEAGKKKDATDAKPEKKKPQKKKPRPSRDALEAAERALTEAKARQAEERKVLAEREAELARERRAIEKAQAEERTRLSRAIEKAEAAYEDALRRWRG